jgi:hypothetical protein
MLSQVNLDNIYDEALHNKDSFSDENHCTQPFTSSWGRFKELLTQNALLGRYSLMQ